MSHFQRRRAAVSGMGAILLGAAVTAWGCGLLEGVEIIPRDNGSSGGVGGMTSASSISPGSVSGSGQNGSSGATSSGAGMGGMGSPTSSSTAGMGGMMGSTSSGSTGGTGGASPCAKCMIPQWVQDLRGTGEQIVKDVAVDSQGNVAIAGQFDNSAKFSFPPQCMVMGCTLTNPGGQNIFVAKLDNAGNVIWSAKGLGSNNPTYVQEAVGVAIDATGDVIVAGQFQDTIDFNCGMPPLASTGVVGKDIFITKLAAADGTCLWSKRFGDAEDQFTGKIAIDSLNNIFLTGYYRSGINFGCGLLSSVAGFDVFVAKFKSDGTCALSQAFPGGGDQLGVDIAVDPFDNILVTGQFDGTFSLGGSMLNAQGIRDMFIGKFSSNNLSYLWSESFGHINAVQVPQAIATDGSGNVALTGKFTGTLEFINGNMHTLTNGGGYDTFVAKFSTLDGKAIWSRRFGGMGDQLGTGIGVDMMGNVFVTGSMANTVMFAGQFLSNPVGQDMFVLMYDSAGTEKCGMNYGDMADEMGIGLAVTPTTGDVVMAGNHQDMVNLGCMKTATSQDKNDALVVKFTPAP